MKVLWLTLYVYMAILFMALSGAALLSIAAAAILLTWWWGLIGVLLVPVAVAWGILTLRVLKKAVTLWGL